MAKVPFDADGVATLPSDAGVYVFLDAASKPIYIGKAAGLRNRVRAYLNGTDTRPSVRHIRRLAREVDVFVTETTKDALLLENALIKQHQPRFNIRLRDDKTYFSLRLDMKAEWPRLEIVRRRRVDGAHYFGPYPSGFACRRTIQWLNALFPIRTCQDSVLYNRTRPCLAYEIKRCVAPCVGLVTRDDYLAIVRKVVRFLSGEDREVVAELERDMEQAADALDFERAAELRDRLLAVKTTVDHPMVAKGPSLDRDAVAVATAGTLGAVAVVSVRSGVLRNGETFRVKCDGGAAEILSAFFGQYYDASRPLPGEIFVPELPEDSALFADIFAGRRPGGVAIKVPEKGEAARLLDMARRNAELALSDDGGGEERASETLLGLERKLDLARTPRRMECYDISHLAGGQVVGSRVAFTEGKPDKSRYRHYKVSEEKNDDFAALEEVLRRRLESGRDDGDLPDLVVIDGGRPQLRRVLDVVKELKIVGVDVIGFAKARSGARAMGRFGGDERVVKEERDLPIVLDPTSEELKLLVRIRDEAHRFAITFSRKLRAKQAVTSVLETIPGVGTKRARALLKRFGGLAGVKRASAEELASTPGMNSETAAAVAAWVRGRSDSTDPSNRS